MFPKHFAESGLSLDRLKTLLEVGAAGSIVKAAAGDPVRQSQFSRQIKELEDFFRAKLVERQGKGIRLSARGRELARISRFFLLGLSNFQQGCLAEEQVFRVGASATFVRQFLLPALFARDDGSLAHFATEVIPEDEIERRLHDLSLDFGIVTRESLSHPLKTQRIGTWTLELWVPKALGHTEKSAMELLKNGTLPFVLATVEMESLNCQWNSKLQPTLACDSFSDASLSLESERYAAVVPSFLAPNKRNGPFFRLRLPDLAHAAFGHYLAWNPRLLRLNPPAGICLERLCELLKR